MNYDFLVLFGGSILLLFLKKKRSRSKVRTRGFLKIFLLLVDGMLLFGGLSLLLYGVSHFIS